MMGYKMTGKEGMTTVELLAGLMIALILLGAAFTVFFAALGSFIRYAGTSENQMITDAACHVIAERIAFAEFVSVGEEPEEDCRIFEFSEEGHLLLDGEELYSDVFYSDKKLVCSIPENREEAPGDVFMLTVKLKDKNGKSLYSSDIVVRLINMEMRNGSIHYMINGDRTRNGDSSDQAVMISFREVQP